MVVCCLEPSKITFWASRWWPSSQARVTSAKSESLSSIKFPNALLMLSWKSFHWRLFKEEQTISLFSFYSRNKRKEFQYSLSPLEIGEMYLTFLFLFLKVENILSDFSFSSRNWGKGIQISLSPLEIGEIVFKFLFLFSIWLFCLSSTTDSQQRPRGFFW